MLAGHMGKSVRSVQVYRTRLIKRGFLTKEFRGRNPSIFRTTIPAQAPKPTAVQTGGSTAVHCGTKPVVPQVVPQRTAPRPQTPLNRMSTGSTERTPERAISEKRSRYTPDQLAIIDSAIADFRSTRKTGRIADRVILAELVWWEGHDPDSVVTGRRTYSEKGYAADGKDEKYARGIIRRIRTTDVAQPNPSPVTYPSLQEQT